MRGRHVALFSVLLGATALGAAPPAAPEPKPVAAAARVQPLHAAPEADAPALVGTKTAPFLAELKARNVPKGSAIIWDVFPEDKATVRIIKAEQALLIAGPAGEYRVKVRLIKGEDVTELRDLVTLTGGVAPGPNPPGPGPKPPEPKPVDPPAPIPGDGLRVLLVFDAKAVPRMTEEQKAVIYGAQVRDYLRATCPKGPDGVTAEARMWPLDTDAGPESKLWQDAFGRAKSKRGESPLWLIVSNGKTGYEGAPPATVEGMLELLKKYGAK